VRESGEALTFTHDSRGGAVFPAVTKLPDGSFKVG